MSRWEQEIEAVFQDMVAWRRHFHQHPELSFQEKKTSQKVYDMLREWGIEARRGMEGYWVEGTIYGASPGPTVALRADMDALPIQDEKKVPYASRVREVMHACGHDAHTAQLLGVAKVLQQNRSRLKGNVRLIFQHAEEVCPGGALTVIREGGLDGVDVIFGVHLWTPIPVGYVAATEGPCMASADEFRIEIRGKGGARRAAARDGRSHRGGLPSGRAFADDCQPFRRSFPGVCRVRRFHACRRFVQCHSGHVRVERHGAHF